MATFRTNENGATRAKLTLERELLALLGGGRDARIAARCHGLDGIARSVPMKGFLPPTEVLLEFCRPAPGLHARDTAIVAKSRVIRDEVLSQIEQQIVHTLSQNGGTMTVPDFSSVCLLIG